MSGRSVEVGTIRQHCKTLRMPTVASQFHKLATQVFTNARLCKALLDRVTDQAHILETGSESYRFRRTVRSKNAVPKA